MGEAVSGTGVAALLHPAERSVRGYLVIRGVPARLSTRAVLLLHLGRHPRHHLSLLMRVLPEFTPITSLPNTIFTGGVLTAAETNTILAGDLLFPGLGVTVILQEELFPPLAHHLGTQVNSNMDNISVQQSDHHQWRDPIRDLWLV